MGLQAEDDGLRDGAESRQGPAQPQQEASAVGRGAVRDREHDGAEPERGGRREIG